MFVFDYDLSSFFEVFRIFFQTIISNFLMFDLINNL